jgi:hypothetical protein
MNYPLGLERILGRGSLQALFSLRPSSIFPPLIISPPPPMSKPPIEYDPESEPKNYAFAWVFVLLLSVVFIFGLLMYPPQFEEVKGAIKPADSALFIGRFHPIIVHLPIGALAVLALFELLCLRKKGEARFGQTSLLILMMGATGSVAGVLFGILLSREGGYEGGNFTLHQGIGIGATVGILIALGLRVSAMGSGHGGVMDCYRILFFGSLGLLGLGAHFGGNMSHGNKYLVQHAPSWFAVPMVTMEKWMLSLVEKPKIQLPDPAVVKAEPPAPTPPTPPTPTPTAPVPVPAPTPMPEPPPAGDGGKLVFKDLLMPIFEAKCNKCHNEEKSKGDLRMDTHEMLMKGGEAEPGKTIIPGKPDESLAISRIMLPLEDDEHMPPEGKDQMTTEETALLRWWIQEGASATQSVKDAKFPAEVKTLVEDLLK